MKVILIVLLTTVFNLCFTQQTEPSKSAFNLSSNQLSLLANSEAAFGVLSGPGVSYSSTKTEFTLRFLATLRFSTKLNLTKPNEIIRPLMGFGTQVRFKKVVLTPAAFYFYNNKWEYATGFG